MAFLVYKNKYRTSHQDAFYTQEGDMCDLAKYCKLGRSETSSQHKTCLTHHIACTLAFQLLRQQSLTLSHPSHRSKHLPNKIIAHSGLFCLHLVSVFSYI